MSWIKSPLSRSWIRTDGRLYLMQAAELVLEDAAAPTQVPIFIIILIILSN